MARRRKQSEVSEAFETLLEEMEHEIEVVSDLGSRAFLSRDFDTVEEARNRAENLTDLRNRVEGLLHEWTNLTEQNHRQLDEAGQVGDPENGKRQAHIYGDTAHKSGGLAVPALRTGCCHPLVFNGNPAYYRG